MNVAKLLIVPFISLVVGTSVQAQQMAPQGAEPSPEQQVEHLDELVGLDQAQREEITGYLTELQVGVGEKEQQVQMLQQQLIEQGGHDYDESAIRESAARIGDLTGEIAADSVLLQARIEAALTQEQRDTLDREIQQQEEQMRQMQEQMMQQEQAPQ